MEPLTKIELRSYKWLGALALTCTVAAELLIMAQAPRRSTFAANQDLRRALRQRSVRSR